MINKLGKPSKKNKQTNNLKFLIFFSFFFSITRNSDKILLTLPTDSDDKRAVDVGDFGDVWMSKSFGYKCNVIMRLMPLTSLMFSENYQNKLNRVKKSSLDRTKQTNSLKFSIFFSFFFSIARNSGKVLSPRLFKSFFSNLHFNFVTNVADLMSHNRRENRPMFHITFLEIFPLLAN